MKDIFYFIGFLSIAFHIYNFLYYDYIKETIANFINDNKNNDLNDIIAKTKIALNVIIPHIVIKYKYYMIKVLLPHVCDTLIVSQHVVLTLISTNLCLFSL